MKTALALLLAITPVAAADQYQSAFDNQYEQQSGYSKSRTCYRSEYREEYIPGTEDDPGYVRSWKETIEVPCNDDLSLIHI